MGGLVEKQIGDAMISLIDRNSPLAQEVIGRDHTVNYLDVAIDEASTKLLALHQPAARSNVSAILPRIFANALLNSTRNRR
jgi:phosphate transport system protein